MNALDIIVVAVLIIAFYKGFSKGIVSAVLSLLAIIVASAISLKFAQVLADYLLQNKILESKFVLLISFALLFIGIILIFRLIIKAIEKALKIALLGGVNKVIGGILYAFIGLFMISGLFWLANFAQLIPAEQKTYSKTYSFVEPVAPRTIDVIAQFIPQCRDVIQKVKAHYNNI